MSREYLGWVFECCVQVFVHEVRGRRLVQPPKGARPPSLVPLVHHDDVHPCSARGAELHRQRRTRLRPPRVPVEVQEKDDLASAIRHLLGAQVVWRERKRGTLRLDEPLDELLCHGV